MSSSLFPARRVLWMPLGVSWSPPSPAVSFCCEEMALSLRLDCEQHDDPFDCPDVALVYNEVFDEVGIPIRDGSASYLLLSHCPWCGRRFPASARDRWFDTIEAEGLDPNDAESLPGRLKTSAWRMDADG